MNVQNVFLEAVGVKESQYPTTGLPEIAFAGKSNVGKSSLINGLINRKSLARTSSAPGKTQTINFYNVEQKLYFVDLPGYGYAKVAKTAKEKWAVVIEDYLHQRKTIKQVVLLVDGRHEPSMNDINMLHWIQSFGYESIVIATKMDKLSRNQQIKSIGVIAKTLEIKTHQVFPFSAMTKAGKEQLWEKFDALVEEGLSNDGLSNEELNNKDQSNEELNNNGL